LSALPGSITGIIEYKGVTVMKMTKLEKRFVNRRKKAENNVKKIQRIFEQINYENIKDVLEIGCGIGLVSAYLARQLGMMVYGTDFDPDEIQLAKEYNEGEPELHFQVEDATNLSFEDNRFNLVISQNVFHHIPDWPKAVAEIGRVLKPDGYLIWLDLILPIWLIKLFKPVTKNYGLCSLNDIQLEFDKAGFEIIQKQKLAHGPFKQYEIIVSSTSNVKRQM
jgi:SAM-dependent methyltransferase